MKKSTIKADRTVSNLICFFAGVFSIVVLVVFRLNDIPVHLALLVILSYVFWFVAVQIARHQTGYLEQDSPLPYIEDIEQPSSETPHSEYYRALLQSLERNLAMFESDYSYCESNLKNIHTALANAIDAAGSTGMLALNAMMAAADTGEVGRGFVTVSKDLVAISEQSIKDLNKLRQIVNKADHALGGVGQVVSEQADHFITQPDGFPFENMGLLSMHLQDCQVGLRQLSERYQKNIKSDVRWLQLGDAVRRLINELINTLYQFELRLNDVLSDMRLVKLSGTLSVEQLLEIKQGIATMEATE